MVKLILGNISFEGSRAIIHEAQGILDCETKAQAVAIGDALCNEFTAYVIPEIFNGKIVLEDGTGFIGDCVSAFLQQWNEDFDQATDDIVELTRGE